jgi:hypothetical protein
MNEALSAFLEVLRRIGVRHAAVGSIASSIHGLPPFTNDADLLLAEMTKGSFYLDPAQAKTSIAAGRPFNLIRLASSGKTDIFPGGANAFNESELNRSVIAD